MTPAVPASTFTTRQQDALDAAFPFGSAWTAYTPTITSSGGGGTLTSVSASGRSLQAGKLVCIQIAIVITTNGAAAGELRATLPVTPAAHFYIIAGNDPGLTGFMLQGIIGPSASFVAIVFSDGTYPGADGAVLELSGIYEAA